MQSRLLQAAAPDLASSLGKGTPRQPTTPAKWKNSDCGEAYFTPLPRGKCNREDPSDSGPILPTHYLPDMAMQSAALPITRHLQSAPSALSHAQTTGSLSPFHTLFRRGKSPFPTRRDRRGSITLQVDSRDRHQLARPDYRGALQPLWGAAAGQGWQHAQPNAGH